MDVVAAGVGLLFAVWVALVLAIVVLVHGARRKGTELAVRARTTRLRLAGGPRGEVVGLRVELARSVEGARSTLAEARRAGVAVGDVPHLVERLHAAARRVDDRLRVLESVPDTGLLVRSLGEARAAVEQVRGGARDLCAALVVATRGRDAEHADLRAACAREAEALREGVRAARLA